MATETITEGDLLFTFENAHPTLFDDTSTHGIGDMKRVDFLVFFRGATWLIEVKDPEDRAIPPQYAENKKVEFAEKIRNGKLFADELAPKLRETLVYLALQHQAPTTDIKYVVLVGLSVLDAAMLLTATNRLKRLCYLPGPHGKAWASHFDVMVLNIAEWNKQLARYSSVRRNP